MKLKQGNITVVKSSRPPIRPPKLLCDDKLDKKLDNYALTSLMNKSFSCLILGKSGSGKTSLLVQLLSSVHLYHKVFHRVYAFIPETSADSIDTNDNVFNKIPEEQIHSDLTIDKLTAVYKEISSNRDKDMKSLLIFDDVQQEFKDGSAMQRLLLKMINNRRHLRLSLIFVAQTYKAVPRPCRLAMTDMFCFRLSKADMDDIHVEHVDGISDDDWKDMMILYTNRNKDPESHVFIYFNSKTGRSFIDWDEIVTPQYYS